MSVNDDLITDYRYYRLKAICIALCASRDNRPGKAPIFKIGMTGFEPATSCSQSRRATKLRYIP